MAERQVMQGVARQFPDLVRQPEGSSLCGQACVATIAGVTLEESIAAFGGTKGGTRTKQVIAALRKLGGKCGDGLIRLKKNQKTQLCIVRQHFDGCKHTHWVVYNNGLYYDPDIGVYREYVEGMRETSFLPVEVMPMPNFTLPDPGI